MNLSLNFVPLNADGSVPCVDVDTDAAHLIYDRLTEMGLNVVYNFGFVMITSAIGAVVVPLVDGRLLSICDGSIVLFESVDDYFESIE